MAGTAPWTPLGSNIKAALKDGRSVSPFKKHRIDIPHFQREWLYECKGPPRILETLLTGSSSNTDAILKQMKDTPCTRSHIGQAVCNSVA